MRIHPFLQDPNAILVAQTPLTGTVVWDDFRRAAYQAMSVMQLELEGERAVLKPNVTAGERFADPDTGIGTHPGFVQGMVEYLLAHGGRKNKITIAEDPRNSDDNERRHWLGTGYERVAQETGAKLHSPSTYTCVKKAVPHPLAHATLNVSRLATAGNTVLINVPKLKTHNLGITTLCLKNLMGLVNVFDRHYCLQSWAEMPEEVQGNTQPRREWFTREMHEQWQAGLARRLADTVQVIRPTLNLVEGIVGREGTGFQRGRNRTLGLAAAGVNMVAVDSLVSYLMGFDPRQLVYLRIAAEAGLGTNDVSQLKVYTVQDDELVLCNDIDSLRIQPAFRVISSIVGENRDIFQEEGRVTGDPSDSLFGISKA